MASIEQLSDRVSELFELLEKVATSSANALDNHKQYAVKLEARIAALETRPLTDVEKQAGLTNMRID